MSLTINKVGCNLKQSRKLLVLDSKRKPEIVNAIIEQMQLDSSWYVIDHYYDSLSINQTLELLQLVRDNEKVMLKTNAGNLSNISTIIMDTFKNENYNLFFALLNDQNFLNDVIYTKKMIKEFSLTLDET